MVGDNNEDGDVNEDVIQEGKEEDDDDEEEDDNNEDCDNHHGAGDDDDDINDDYGGTFLGVGWHADNRVAGTFPTPCHVAYR